ncbi:MAG: ABC transporter ATP-binding protein [Bacteroidia bacterium]|nr:ABC transporter ATP-binding protein [Bacteroidia bacterium]
MESPLLHATKLSKSYAGRPILREIELTLEKGQVCALIGHSGSGKTTLLYLLALLERADQGEILWKGQSLYSLSAREQARWRNREVGFVFQFFHLVAELNLWENVALPAILAGASFRSQKKKAIEWLERVGLAHRAYDLPSRLSGGEQQRVAIARALFQEPTLVLADEPTGNLDSEQAQEVWGLFMSLAQQQGSAVLVATHNLHLAQQTQAIFQLERGRLRKIELA